VAIGFCRVSQADGPRGSAAVATADSDGKGLLSRTVKKKPPHQATRFLY